MTLETGSMLRRLALGFVALGLVPFALAGALGRVADAAGTRSGRVLAEYANALAPARSLLGPGPKRDAPPAPAPAEPAANEPALAEKPSPGRGARRTAKSATPQRGVRVSARTVLALAREAVLPEGLPVPASGARPAGIRLGGVSGLGIGLREGDVLTRVSGVSVRTAAQVIQLVAAARTRRAREISAEFWRDGRAWTLVVEQPYAEAESVALRAP